MCWWLEWLGDWLVGWLICWSVCWLVGLLVWSVGLLVSSLVGLLASWSVGLVGRSFGYCLVGIYVRWFGWSGCWLVGWLVCSLVCLFGLVGQSVGYVLVGRSVGYGLVGWSDYFVGRSVGLAAWLVGWLVGVVEFLGETAATEGYIPIFTTYRVYATRGCEREKASGISLKNWTRFCFVGSTVTGAYRQKLGSERAGTIYRVLRMNVLKLA